MPSARIPQLLTQLASFDSVSHDKLNATLEEYYQGPDPSEPSTAIVGPLRIALDKAFSKDTVEEIIETLETLSGDQAPEIGTWAQKTLEVLQLRSPTSLKIALEANKRGSKMTLSEALQMEMNIATALCVSPYLFSRHAAVE